MKTNYNYENVKVTLDKAANEIYKSLRKGYMEKLFDGYGAQCELTIKSRTTGKELYTYKSYVDYEELIEHQMKDPRVKFTADYRIHEIAKKLNESNPTTGNFNDDFVLSATISFWMI